MAHGADSPPKSRRTHRSKKETDGRKRKQRSAPGEHWNKTQDPPRATATLAVTPPLRVGGAEILNAQDDMVDVSSPKNGATSEHVDGHFVSSVPSSTSTSFTTEQKTETSLHTNGKGRARQSDVNALLHAGDGGSGTPTTPSFSTDKIVSVADFVAAKAEKSERPNGGKHGSGHKRRRRGDAYSRFAFSRKKLSDDRDKLDEGELWMRYGVDSVKLVPQGLVERLDARINQSFLARVVQQHVRQWLRRAGFDADFLHEITTLLTAYYPCAHATILDEVLVRFLFKRPELMRELLRPMVDKLRKAGDSATADKYPIIQAFARRCDPSYAHSQDRSSHDTACLTLLRCLVEDNTHKFVLSPWIAACARQCSRQVTDSLWMHLLNSWTQANTIKTSEEQAWHVLDAGHQVFELIEDEKTVARSSNSPLCPLATSFVRLVLLDGTIVDLPAVCDSIAFHEATVLFFTHASTSASSSLCQEWMDQRSNAKPHDAFKALVAKVVPCSMKMSVKKTKWFSNHILSFILHAPFAKEQRCTLLTLLLEKYSSMVFGGVPKEEWEEASRAFLALKTDATGLTSSEDVHALVDKHSTKDIIGNVQWLLRLLQSCEDATASAFVSAWMRTWCKTDAYPISVPWRYIYSLLSVTVDRRNATKASHLLEGHPQTLGAFRLFIQRLCSLYLSHVDDVRGYLSIPSLLVRYQDVVKLLLPSDDAIREPLLASSVSGLFHACSGDPEAPVVAMKNILSAYLSRPSAVSCIQDKDEAVDASATSRANDEAAMNAFRSIQLLCKASGDRKAAVDKLLGSKTIVSFLVSRLQCLQSHQLVLLDTISSIIEHIDATYATEWYRQHVVERLVLYSVHGAKEASRTSMNILQTLGTRVTPAGPLVIASLLRTCTSLCCGCGQDKSTTPSTSTCSSLLVSLLETHPEALDDTLVFLQRELWSCRRHQGGLNPFLLSFLEKAVASMDSLKLHPAVRMALTPLASESSPLAIQMAQLQLLRSVCLCASVSEMKAYVDVVTSEGVRRQVSLLSSKRKSPMVVVAQQVLRGVERVCRGEE